MAEEREARMHRALARDEDRFWLFESRQGQYRIAINKGHFKWMEICKLMPDGSWLPVYRTEGAPGPVRTSTDPILLEQVMQDIVKVFCLSCLFFNAFFENERIMSKAQRFADLMLADPNLRQLFHAFMVAEGLDMLSVAQHLAVNNPVRRFSHRCKL